MEPWSGRALLHAGGWDEMLLILVPALVFAFVRWIASRRARREDDEA